MSGFALSIMVLVSSLAAWQAGIYFQGFWYGAAGFVASLLVFAFVYGATIESRKDMDYRAALERWERSWACLKCGSSFVQDGALTSATTPGGNALFAPLRTRS